MTEDLSAPLAVSWEVTYACNLTCIHCLSSSGMKRPGELAFEECLSVVDQLADLKVFYTYIGGGEPFARNDLIKILEYADDRGVVMPISTNGTLLTRTVAEQLSKLSNIRLQVSLDGASPWTHDPIRGKGSFERTMKNIPILREYGIPFYITTVLTRLNFPELDDLYGLSRRLGSRLRVQRLRPSGRGEASWEYLHPTPEQSMGLHRWLLNHPDVLTADSFFHLNALGERLKGFSMCGAAKMICLISPTGDVYPCPFIQPVEFIAGNVREKSIREMWSDSPIFRQFRELELHECQSCPAFDAGCHGGCRATAYFVRKSLDARDAECMSEAMKKIDLPVLGSDAKSPGMVLLPKASAG